MKVVGARSSVVVELMLRSGERGVSMKFFFFFFCWFGFDACVFVSPSSLVLVLVLVIVVVFRCAVKVPKTVQMWAEELKTANAAVNGGTDTKVSTVYGIIYLVPYHSFYL